MTHKILILKTNKKDLDLLTDTLSQKGYQLMLTNEDSDLLNVMNKQNPSPDLIIVDKLIEGVNSYGICQQIKLLGKGQDIPIVFLNRGQDNFEPETMFKYGGADYLNYPCSSLEILARIENQLQLKTLGQQLKEQNNRLAKLEPHYQKIQESLIHTKKYLERLSLVDPITKLSNYERLHKILQKEWSRCSRQRISSSDAIGTHISLIIAQINDFKSYKDHYEMELASNCLKMVADAIKETVKRPTDLVAFYDREKFAILLPNTDHYGVQKVANLINQKIQELKIPHHYSSLSDYVTLTMGIATGIPTHALPANTLIEVAENALIQALQLSQENAIVLDSF